MPSRSEIVADALEQRAIEADAEAAAWAVSLAVQENGKLSDLPEIQAGFATATRRILETHGPVLVRKVAEDAKLNFGRSGQLPRPIDIEAVIVLSVDRTQMGSAFSSASLDIESRRMTLFGIQPAGVIKIMQEDLSTKGIVFSSMYTEFNRAVTSGMNNMAQLTAAAAALPADG